ncbi:MAG: nucleotidyltransferase domain-containing protein [Chloroflexia bacterium]|nr:nucleotidyltransferase domain-containing protein [Chloroflexia bacterium]
MIALVEDNREAIVALCERYGVRRLSVFGSAVTGTFDPETSDVDFLVDLGEYDPGVARRYLGLIVALEHLFGRHVDVVTEKAVKDPDFRRELEATAKVIYGTVTSKTAA